MTLVDANRQWFKSRVGLAETETPRTSSFCAYTMLEERLTIVEDTLNDPRFAKNPLVRGEPRIRFYAGAPLITPEGYGLGSLCVLDREPRTLTTQQTQALAILARTVMAMMELRRSNTQLAEARAAITTLNTLLPICADCGVTRTDDAYWDKVKTHLHQHGDPNAVDCLCAECAKTHAAHA
jgi:GAF domain-containing protein